MSHRYPISDHWWRRFAYHWAIPRDNTLDGSQHARPAVISLSKSCKGCNGCKDPPRAPCHPSKTPAQSVRDAALESSTLVELVGMLQPGMLQLVRSIATGLDFSCQSVGKASAGIAACRAPFHCHDKGPNSNQTTPQMACPSGISGSLVLLDVVAGTLHQGFVRLYEFFISLPMLIHPV